MTYSYNNSILGDYLTPSGNQLVVENPIIINSGSVNNTVIGNNIPSSGYFTNIKISGIDVSISGHTHTSSQITDFNEAVDDRIGSGLFVAGTGININYDDVSNSLTVSVSGLINNPTNNRILTSRDDSTTGIDAQSKLTFDGRILELECVCSSGNAGFVGVGDGNIVNFRANQFLNDNVEPPRLIFRRTRGSEAAPQVANSGDGIFAIRGETIDYSGNVAILGGLRMEVIEPASPTGLNPATKIFLRTSSGGNNLLDKTLTLNSDGTLVNTGPIKVNDTLVSLEGHTHAASDITDFNSSVSGLLTVKNIVAGTGIDVINSSGIYTITSTGSGIVVDQSKSLVTTVFNKTGSPIPKMTAVYINGGQGDLPTISLAIATTDMTSAGTYGLTYEAIPNMQSGKVIVFGALAGLNTDQFNPTAPTGNVNGSILYLSPAVSGSLTLTKPSAPDHIVAIGTIVRTHQNEGVIEVRVQNGFELEELHNVAISGVTNGQFLQYNSGSGLWVPSSSGNFSSLFINNNSVTPINTPIYSLGSISGVNNINFATDRMIQTLTLNGTSTTFTKGAGSPTDSTSVDVVLRISVNSATSITWSIVTDWFSQPPIGALATGTYLFLLRAIGSTIIEGHYLGDKTN